MQGLTQELSALNLGKSRVGGFEVGVASKS